jgi:hypothetical protein
MESPCDERQAARDYDSFFVQFLHINRWKLEVLDLGQE